MANSTRLAYVLLLAFVFSIPWEEAIVLPGIGSVARLIGIAAFLLALHGLFSGGMLRLRRPSLLLVLSGLYLGWQLLSILWSIDSNATVSSAITLVQLLVMVWLIWQLCPEPDHQRGLAQAFVLGGYVTALNILWIFFLQADSIRIDGRIASAGANQNDVAAAMAVAIPLAWMLVLHHRRGLLFWTNLLYLPVAVAAVVLTASRGGTVTLVVALLVVPFSYFQLRTRVQLLLLSLLVVLGSAVIVVPNAVIDRATPNFIRLSTIPADLAAGNLTGRLLIWQGGFEALQERPVLGYGANTFREVVRPILGTGWAPHNTFIAVAVGSGLVGLTLFVLILLSVAVPLILVRAPRTSVPIILFLALAISLLPLGWETHKITWFVLAFLGTVHGVQLTAVHRPARRHGAAEHGPRALS